MNDTHRPSGGEWALRARCVLPDGVREACVHVADGRIVALRPPEAAPARVPVVRLPDDEVLLPGFVDVHVHANDPGRTDWEGFVTATRAAAAGGVTTIVDMPLNSVPATVDAAALRAKVAAMREAIHVDVGLWGGAIPGNADAMPALADAGVLGFKAFLSPSGVEEFPNVDEPALAAALSACAALDRVLLAHAEAPAALLAMTGDPRRHASWVASRPPAAEVAAIQQLARGAAASRARVHVVHVASTAAATAVRVARDAGARVSAETCAHYLVFDGDAVADGDTRFKCAPPLRGADERAGLWRALEAGTLSFVTSDHSPSPAALKRLDTGDFGAAWGGIASLQVAPTASWTEANARGLGLSDLARWWCSGPARLAGLEARKGALRLGADADLVAFAPDEAWRVEAGRLQHRHAITPYDGRALRGRVRATWSAGALAWDAAREAFGAASGRWLRRSGNAVLAVDPRSAFA